MNKADEPYRVMNLPENYKVLDFSSGYESEKISRYIQQGGWAVGGYDEKRPNMYLAPQYENRRNIHLGIDIWAPAGEPVYAPLDGTVKYTELHDQEGNYGATVVLKHLLKGEDIYALYGHLSLKSLKHANALHSLKAGDVVGWLGKEHENGNWPPHLHYQLSRKDPGEADMPGVVSEDEREEALHIYPDPRIILGDIY